MIIHRYEWAGHGFPMFLGWWRRGKSVHCFGEHAACTRRPRGLQRRRQNRIEGGRRRAPASGERRAASGERRAAAAASPSSLFRSSNSTIGQVKDSLHRESVEGFTRGQKKKKILPQKNIFEHPTVCGQIRLRPINGEIF